MRQILVLLTLVLLMQVVIRHGVGTSSAFDSMTLLTTGFILVGAYTMGELFRRMRLPALLGYLAAGILFGPKLVALTIGDETLAPVGAAAIHELGLINVLAVGVIGTMGGGEIKLPELRENFGKLAAICAAVFVLVLPIVGGAVLGLTFVAPNVVPFLAELPLAGRIAGALLFGTLAVGMSPAATLALMQEVHARGRFTSLVLGVVVLGDLVLVATFLLALALAKLLISPEGLSLHSLAEQLPHIGAEFGWALVLGLIVGLAFIAYLRFVGREVLLFSLAVVFVTSFVAARLHAETLLAFLVAGFVVQNFSRHGHTLIEAFERIALPVFVIYFTAQAAALDLLAVTVYLPLTLILITLRSGLFVLGVGFGARKAGVDATTRQHLQVSFFSQGGVDLVLAAMVAEAIPGWGAEVQTVTMATILFYVVGGPPLLARALDSVGESAAARERGVEQLTATREVERRDVAREDAIVEFALPESDDPTLRGRLEELRATLLSLRDGLVDAGVLTRARQRAVTLGELAASIRDALTSIELEPGPEASRVVAQARARLDAAVAESGRAIDLAQLCPFDPRTLARLFDTLDHAQEFDQSFRVPRSQALFERRGDRLTRAIRFARRIRRKLVGPGSRTVALGRLWRYHVCLGVPIALWRSTRPIDGELHHALLEHYRETRAQLDAILDGSWSKQAGPTTDSHASDHEPSEPEPPSFERWLADARASAVERGRALADRLDRDLDELEQGLLHGLAQAWQGFLDDVELAGTLERPSWRTRPSSRYDAARAAIAELLDRSERDREIAAGRLDALLALAHAEHVATVIHAAALEFEQDFSAALAELDEDFDRLLAAGATAIAESLQPALARMREHVERLRRRVAILARSEPAALTTALRATPEQLAPSSELSTIDKPGDSRRTIIRLQAWLLQTLAADFGVARARADEELGAGLDSLRQALADVGRVVDYHLGHESAEDHDLGERIAGLLERARSQLGQLARAARQHVDELVGSAADASLEPIRNARWDELRRRLRRLDEGQRLAVGDWARERAVAALERVRTLGRSLNEELSALFEDRHTRAAIAAWQRALFGPRSRMPESYQRLFTSVPAEIVGLLIPRPELEILTAAAERCLARARGSILVHGDRGVGKRTLLRQLAIRLEGRTTLHWLRLSPMLEREADLARELAPWLGLRGVEEPADLASLQEQLALVPTRLGSDERRPMIIVENAERLFRRTPEGLAHIRGFLELIAATESRALWLVLVAEPAVALLDVAIELRARFETSLYVPPMDTEQLAAVLDTRHRLSGYGLRIEVGVPTLSQWLREPLAVRPWQSRERSAYARLARLSGGNVRQTLRLWLTAVRSDPGDASVVVFGPLPSHACPLLTELSLSSRVLLAALLVHGPLPRGELLELHGSNAVDLEAELARLEQLGLAIPVDAGSIGVETRLIQPLTAELRACNLL